MYKFFEIISPEQWNGFIEKTSSKASFFQSYEWGLFEQQRGKKVWFLGVGESEEELLGVMLVIKISARRGKYIHVRNGPVIDWKNIELVNTTMRYLKEFAKSQNCDFIRISPMISATSENINLMHKFGLVDCQMHDVDAEVTWMLDLEVDEAQILNGMRKNTRYYINRAKKDGVTIEKSVNVEDIDKFWPIFEDTVKRQKWTAYPKEYIKQEFATFVKEGKALLILAKYNEKYIAGSIFIYFNGIANYHHSGSLTEFRKIPAAYLIQWESILEAQKRGMKKYNFFGIARTDDEKHPWAGLTFFKKGFGGYQDENIHAQDLPLNWKYWIAHFFEKFEKKRRGY